MEDVIVIGGGPAGNGAALEIAKAGYAVTVIDSRTQLGDKLCTGIVSVECLRDFPGASGVVQRRTRAAVFYSPSGKSLRLEKESPQACIVDRVAYVSGIAEQARAAGARYLLGRTVTDVSVDARGVRVEVDGGDGLEARVAVIASGFGTPLTARLGLGKPADFVMAAQVELLAPDVQDVEVYLGRQVAPGFFAWLAPTAGGKAYLGLLARSQASDYLELLWKSLERRGKVTVAVGPVRRWGIPLRPLERTVADRVVVIGDAAGQVKPTTGGGIYYALLSSRDAAAAIDGALRAGDLSAANLGAYERVWRARLGSELEAGRRIRAVAERLGDWQIDQIVGILGANGFLRDLLVSPEVSFDWHGRVVQRVLGLPTLADSMRLLGFSDLWRRLTRERN